MNGVQYGSMFSIVYDIVALVYLLADPTLK